MSAFSFKRFNADAYLALRPAYNRALVQWLLGYHVGKRVCAADIACGPGTFTVNLSSEFDHVLGVDPSLSMIESARNNARTNNIVNVKYKQGFGESLPIATDTVDLLAVMQGAHWFKFADFLSEAQRVLRPGGTLVLVGYGYPEIASWPESMKGRTFARTLATDKRLLRNYWDNGYTLIDELYAPFLDAIQASTGYTDVQHLQFPKTEQATGLHGINVLPESWIDSRTMPLDGFRAYMKTWSAYKSWKDQHPHDADIIDTFFDEQQSALGKSGSEEVKIEWPHFAIVARKRL
ncbi:trans-aconitate methyltransferase 1 [Coemansia sp. RSA 455]|nr:trans-aconitate methyltransferase 1 [Coemansia sp. S17]KAJ2015078.1 trans-aconitate methyltransferase 1 [Coemansia sp. S680]KAJ2033588.1 trans-aconitate methyltransferase 1 [Coemansia sp. S3946]KAJ2045921.1 trans-aconitate methyltransferase 1 [Coemansia sp. S16]KAJ2105053.1 trans-aconitate methyltransferase 1 [Coemansia sp. S142-1]KAJ2253505.1 trans-aconitate methyltransferase 1 [Coemansia sp. RSA 455]KAJ2462749.1 trans-aconitate methyltransferase 1 [Coemansia sp. RSA 2337]